MRLSRSVVLSLLVSLAAIAVSPPVVAQSSSGPFTFSSSSSPCARIAVTAQSSVVIKVTGTFSMTLQPEVSVQGQAPDNTVVTPSTSTTASKQSTITATGSYSSAVGSYDTFLVCVTSYVSGTATVYLNTSPATNASLFGSGGVATAVPFSGVTASTNTNALSEGTGGSNSPTGSGQIAGSQLWMGAPLIAPTITASLTGGNIGSGQTVVFSYTLNTAAGETLPSAITTPNMAAIGCGSGGTCSLTLVAPTLPAGYSGYTAYFCDVGAGGGCTNPAKVLACVNITGNCTVTSATLNSGIAQPTIATAYLQPANPQTNECPQGVIPWIWLPDTSGNYHSWAGVDWNSSNGQTSGTFEICHRTWFTDIGVSPPSGNNAFVSMGHQYGTGTNTANQDRTLWLTAQTPVNDSSTHYGLTDLQAELDFNCNGCNINGSPDAEVSTISAQSSLQAVTNWGTNGYQTNAIMGRLFRGGAGLDTSGMNAVYGAVINQNATGSGRMAALRGSMNSTATAPNMAAVGLEIDQPTNTAFGFVEGIVTGYIASFTPRSTDRFIDQRIHNWAAYFNAPIWGNALNAEDLAAFPVNASLAQTGALSIAQGTIPPPGSGPACSGGASQYTYKFVAVDGNGGTVASTQVTTPSTCTNPLSAGNPATLQPNQFTLTSLAPYVEIDVYRTSGPMATGKIGSLSCNSNIPILGCNAFVDSGLAADGGTVPSVNTTGTLSVAGYTKSAGNKFFVAANFTTAANTSLQTITGLSFNLLPVAGAYQFHCAVAYSQGTANAAVSFGIQAATVNPTNIFATGTIGTSTTAATSGVLATLSSTTATSIVSATPSATATNFTAQLDGTIEQPANDAGQVINIMVSTATSGDAVTVLRGSYCYVY